MSKVLIDRAVLEATLEHAEFVSGAACEADDAIRAVLAAPISTPELPVKAYYHEAPNEYGGLNKSVGLEVRHTFIDAPLVLQSDALMQIACLEGEIAKRDAELCERTEEVEHALADLNNALAELAAPVQRVSVPDGWRLVPVNATEAILDVLYSNGMDESDSLLQDIWSAMIAAAPAAPAADAGLVEALALCVKSLDQLLPYLGKVPADIGLLNDALMAARPALAAHRAQGVV